MENIRTLIKILKDHGWVLKREGGNHYIFENIENGKTIPVPRHKLNKFTAEGILKSCGINKEEMFKK